MQRIRGGQAFGLWLREQPGARRFVVCAGVAFVIVLACLVLFTGSVLSTPNREAFGNLVSVPLATIAAICAGLTTWRSTGRTRSAWALLALGCTCWALAEISWAVLSYAPGASGLPGVDDFFYLLSMPFGIAALALFPGHRWRGPDRVRSVLDGLTIGGSMFFVCRGLGIVISDGGPLSAQFVALAYPLGDVVMLSMALIVCIKATRAAYLHLGLIVAAMVSYIVGDSVYAIRVAAGTYVPGGLLDLTWVFSYLLFALAALAPNASRTPEMRPAGEYRASGIAGGVVACAMAAAVLVAVLSPGANAADPAMIVSGFCVAALFTARQAWLTRDITRLNVTLQNQVEILRETSTELSKEVARSEGISESVIDGVLVADPQGRVTFANATAAALLGRKPADLIGLIAADLLHPSGSDRTGHAALRAALLDGTVLAQGEALLGREDGSEVPVELSVGPIERDGRRFGVVVVFRDVSARRAVDKMKNEFMSVVSHELRTPLTSIRGSLGLLNAGLGGTLEPSGKRMVTIALHSSERLSRLISDMLDVERLEAGSLSLTLGQHEALSLLDVAVQEMHGIAQQSEIALVVGKTNGWVIADGDRVVQTLTNLISNAIKFSPAGSAVVVSARPVNGIVEFSVADRGRGIPADKLETIFERFEQVDSSDARQKGGTGLGLAICRDLVQLHGGRIWATSEPGAGATFRFTLPATSGSAAEAVDVETLDEVGR
jgi:PAS domain S-box-containing protein